MGEKDQGRSELVMEATGRTAFRKGDWVLIPPYKGPALSKNVNIEIGNAPDYQLYNLKEDVGEQNNMATGNPDKLEEMIADYEAIRGQSGEISGELDLK